MLFQFQEASCKTCNNSIPKGRWFCPFCGRDRFVGIKKWEILLIGIIGVFCLSSITIIPVSLLDLIPYTKTPAIATRVPATSGLDLPATSTKRPSNTRAPNPTITLLDSDFTQYSCPDKSRIKLRVGDRAVVAFYDVNLRSSPIVPNDWDANIVATLRKGNMMLVTGGPKCAHEGTWWEVKTDRGYTGWVRELQPGKILLEPIK